MGKKIMDKVLGFIGFEDEAEDSEEKQRRRETDRFREEEEQPAQTRKKGGQVVNLHTQRQVRVVVCEPKVYDDALAIADNLKNRRPVIVNLEDSEAELAKRVVDFISGICYALDGSMQKVGSGIFLFVPSNMDIAGDIPEELADKNMFAWLK
ncbi:MAG: cell division protein SepF [Bacillota bacterium]|jgi:cell division inhibitor SepF